MHWHKLARVFSHMAVASLLCAFAAGAQAERHSTLDKHARKIEHRVAHYSEGSHLHLLLKDGTDLYGKLGARSADSFALTSAEDNAQLTVGYAEVDRVGLGVQDVSETGPPRSHRRLLKPVLLLGGALGAGAIAYTVAAR